MRVLQGRLLEGRYACWKVAKLHRDAVCTAGPGPTAHDMHAQEWRGCSKARAGRSVHSAPAWRCSRLNGATGNLVTGSAGRGLTIPCIPTQRSTAQTAPLTASVCPGSPAG